MCIRDRDMREATSDEICNEMDTYLKCARIAYIQMIDVYKRQTLGCKASSVSVAIKDVPENQWKEKVWDAHIIPDEPYLYKKPRYTCE